MDVSLLFFALNRTALFLDGQKAVILISCVVLLQEYCKRSRQIPAFGDWDYANDLPITQYFESARQAGLIRYSSSSGECDQYTCHRNLYAIDGYPKLPRTTIHQRKVCLSCFLYIYLQSAN